MDIEDTGLITLSTHKRRRNIQAPPIALGALLRNIIARAELHIRLFEVIFHPVYRNQFLQASRAGRSDVMALVI